MITRDYIAASTLPDTHDGQPAVPAERPRAYVDQLERVFSARNSTMIANPAERLLRLKVGGDLTSEEEADIKNAIEAAMSKVDDAIAVVNAMIEEIEQRKQKKEQADAN